MNVPISIVSTPTFASTQSSGSHTAYGTVPKDISMPDPYADLSKVYPNLSASNAATSADILSQLQGQLSPETINAIRNSAAAFGVSSGLPGSQFAGQSGLTQLGLNVENMQNQGIQNYMNALSGIKSTQTVSPETQSNVNTQNAIWAAAPDPKLAAEEQQRLFQQQLDALSKAASSPAAGTSTSQDVWHPMQIKTFGGAGGQPYISPAYYGPAGDSPMYLPGLS